MSDVRRNQKGQYLVETPETLGKRGKPLKTKEVGYTRVTNVAKLLEDPHALINWRVRTTMLGLVKDDLTMVTRVRSYATDPEGYKDELDKLADEAYEKAEGWAGANHGTALHLAMESVTAGALDPQKLLEPFRTDALAALAMLDRYGLVVEPGWNEQMVVLDEHRVAGTFDLLLRSQMQSLWWDEGLLRIGDWKTSSPKAIEYSFNAWAIQLALYRMGLPYSQHPEYGGARLEWPDPLCSRYAAIVHVPAGLGTADLYLVDLEAGREAALHALWAREWRKRSGLGMRWAPDPAMLSTPELAAAVEASIAANVVTLAPKPIGDVHVAVANHPQAAEEAVERPRTVLSRSGLGQDILGAPDGSSAPTAPIGDVFGLSAAREAARASTFDVEALTAMAANVPLSPPEALQPPAAVVPAPQVREENSSVMSAAVAAAAAVFPGATVEPDFVPPRLKELGDLSRIDEATMAGLLATERSIQKGRIATIAQHGGQEGLEMVAARWPVGVPGFGGTHEHTWMDLWAMEEAIWYAEGKLGLPFPSYDGGNPQRTAMVIDATQPLVPSGFSTPTPPPTPTPTSTAPVELIADTDRTVPVSVLDGLRARIAAMPPDTQQWVGAVIGACAAASYPIGISSLSQRRVAIVKAMLDVADKALRQDVRPGVALISVLTYLGMVDALPVEQLAGDLPFILGMMSHADALRVQECARQLLDTIWFVQYPTGWFVEAAPF